MSRVLITGATSGIGMQLAKDYAADGWEVIACGRNQQQLDLLASAHSMETLRFDITNPDEVAAAASVTDQPIDLLILNAGICEYIDDPIHFDNALLKRVLDINVVGLGNCLNGFLPKLESGAHLAVIGSVASYLPFSRAQAYGASKAAVAYLTTSMAVDLAKHNIDVSLVSPGFVETPLTERNDFEMPMSIDVATASAGIRKGLAKRKKHVRVPALFTAILALLGRLPLSWRHRLALSMVK